MNQNKPDSPKEKTSWIWIIIAFYVFWPAGLFLLFKRLSQEMNFDYRRPGDIAYASPTARKETPAPTAKRTGAKRSSSLTREALIPRVMSVLGGIFTFFGVFGAAQEILDYLSYGFFYPRALLIPLFFGCGLGMGMLFTAQRLKKRRALLKRYMAIIGQKPVVSVDEIAAIESTSYEKACRELEALLETGILPGAYLDRSRRLLVVSAKDLENDPLYHSAKEKRSPTADVSYGATDSAAYSEKDDYIRRIRKVNDEIANVPLSDRIDRIEELTAKMFDAVERDPEKRPQIEAFLNYYLPTTLKILNAYRDFENQTARGETITSAMRDIENIMDTLVAGFEKQLDLLFADDALDITTDISVLEGMLAKDGLSGDEISSASRR